jgi:hypothetical protein
MSSYEIRIKEVHGSTVAIGDHAKASGAPGPLDRDAMTSALEVLLGIVGSYDEPEAKAVRDLARAAQGELEAPKPRKEVFRRLVDATRTMTAALGSKIVQAGALADAVSKVADLMRHL